MAFYALLLIVFNKLTGAGECNNTREINGAKRLQAQPASLKPRTLVNAHHNIHTLNSRTACTLAKIIKS